jgi:hypothetical protein
MTALIERAPQPARPIIRRYSIQATLGNHYLILDDDGRPVPTVAREGARRRPAASADEGARRRAATAARGEAARRRPVEGARRRPLAALSSRRSA